MSGRPVVLSIHAVDNLGEEGILADARVCAELECRSLGVVTAVLTSGAGGAEAMERLSLSVVAQQFEASVSRWRPAAVRIGLLSDRRQVELIADLLQEGGSESPVVAPVMRIGGARVTDDDTLAAMRERLFPLAQVVVVRGGDLPLLTGGSAGGPEEMKQAAASVREQGAPAVLVAGVLSRGRALDLLDDGGRVGLFDASRLAAPRVPGLSGSHAAALACHLARGQALPRAVDAAQRYIAFRLRRGR